MKKRNIKSSWFQCLFGLWASQFNTHTILMTKKINKKHYWCIIDLNGCTFYRCYPIVICSLLFILFVFLDLIFLCISNVKRSRLHCIEFLFVLHFSSHCVKWIWKQRIVVVLKWSLNNNKMVFWIEKGSITRWW